MNDNRQQFVRVLALKWRCGAAWLSVVYGNSGRSLNGRTRPIGAH